MTNGKVAILISGGLDSAILLHLLLKKYSHVQPVYVRSGHVWEKAELIQLKRFLGRLKHRNLKPLACLSLETKDLYGNHWSVTGKQIPNARSQDEKVYLPGKNLLLIAKASVFCSLKHIPALALGTLKTNPFLDAQVSFFRALEKVCSQALYFKFRILTPFSKLTKKEVMKMGKNLPLELTYSCLNPHPSLSLRERGSIHCGTCNKCAERKKAFRSAGLTDKTKYA